MHVACCHYKQKLEWNTTGFWRSTFTSLLFVVLVFIYSCKQRGEVFSDSQTQNLQLPIRVLWSGLCYVALHWTASKWPNWIVWIRGFVALSGQIVGSLRERKKKKKKNENWMGPTGSRMCRVCTNMHHLHSACGQQRFEQISQPAVVHSSSSGAWTTTTSRGPRGRSCTSSTHPKKGKQLGARPAPPCADNDGMCQSKAGHGIFSTTRPDGDWVNREV